MVTAGNCKSCLYSTLTSTFLGCDRRYANLVEMRNMKRLIKLRIISSHTNLIRGKYK